MHCNAYFTGSYMILWFDRMYKGQIYLERMQQILVLVCWSVHAKHTHWDLSALENSSYLFIFYIFNVHMPENCIQILFENLNTLSPELSEAFM